MNLNRLIIAAAAMAFTAGAYAEHYKVIAPMSPDASGKIARLVNYDKGTAIDSLTVQGEAVAFEGNIDEPILARVLVDGSRLPVFVLEPGTISFNMAENVPFGSMLNDQLRQSVAAMQQIGTEYQAAATDEAREAVYARYEALIDSVMVANSDNPLGYYMFLNSGSSQYEASQLRESFEKYPYFGTYDRSKKLLEMAEKREATQPGKKFVDFEVPQPDGTVARLSDYVGKGKYTLVDFWASWCGPCIRQSKVIKEINNKYKDSGKLDVLGVAVWDEVDATRDAIKRHGMEWDCILDAQSIPTDIYGISGIPCIILFGPDGTILSRDKQGDDLKADVDAALAQ